MKLEDAIAEGSARLPDKDTLPDTTPRAYLEWVEQGSPGIPPLRTPSEAQRRRSGLDQDFPEHKAEADQGDAAAEHMAGQIP
jgi:hypothetical protein